MTSDGRQTSPPAVVPMARANILRGSWLEQTSGCFSHGKTLCGGRVRGWSGEFEIATYGKSQVSMFLQVPHTPVDDHTSCTECLCS